VVTREVDYTSDIFGRRIGKTIDADGSGSGTAVEEIYIYDGLREERGNAGDHILLRFDESEDLTDRFLNGPNVDQVMAQEEVTSTSTAGDVLWALGDHLGTVRDVVEYDSGTDITTVVNHLAYSSFGEITSESNAAIDFLFGFTSRERDEESDLQYNRARYLTNGRWISEDPIGFAAGDENLVRYTGNMPAEKTDSSGLREVCGPYVWLYAGSWCKPAHIYYTAIDAAAEVVNCWWQCEVNIHRCAAGLAADLGGAGTTLTFTHLPISKPGVYSRLPGSSAHTSLQRLLSVKLREAGYGNASIRQLLQRGAVEVKQLPIRSGIKSGVAGIALVELGFSIYCGLQCS